MRQIVLCVTLCVAASIVEAAEGKAFAPSVAPLVERDWRNVRTGLRIPGESYCDQPYVVITKEGHWLCTLTTGPGREGHHTQHIVSTISRDQGHTWSKLVAIEPSDGPEASWVVPLVVPSGRVYAFYTYNGDNVRSLRGKPVRVDTVGWFAYRYSDDGGRSWSAKRHRLPMRLTACDRANDWGGKVQIFWGIDKPKVAGRRVYFAFTKLGKYMLDQGEGWLYCSDNILAEPDVAKLRWELLPTGEHGLRAPEFGSVQEEHNVASLSDGSLTCVYRTSKGHPCHAYSRDGGRTWSKPEPMTYTPGGRRMKTPRACPRVWRCSNGKFLFWFHNTTGRSFQGRNPVWVSAGVERHGAIHWSQPEVLLYEPDPRINGMSYPDLIEQDGKYWVTETQKTIARVHAVDATLLEGMWRQNEVREVVRDGLLVTADGQAVRRGVALPKALDLRDTGGLTLDFRLRLDDLAAGQAILDGRDGQGRGILLSTGAQGTIHLTLADGTARAAWHTDAGALAAGRTHHVVAIVDAAPRLISFAIDGVLCDGGPTGLQGWTRYESDIADVRGSGTLKVGPALKGAVQRLRVYGRYLRVSEAVANFHAGQ